MRTVTITCIGCGVDVPDSAPQRRRCTECRKRSSAAKSVRGLQPGEPRPNGQPKRYVSSHGYVRLRWRVGPREYVECYEHRLVAGFPAGKHVHHRDGAKANNRPENLRPLTGQQHGSHHARIDAAEAGRLYASGMSSYAVARMLGCSPSAAWRAIRRAGVPTRPEARIAIPKRERQG